MSGRIVLLVDSEYDDLEVERTAVEAAGGELHRAVPSCRTAADVLAHPLLPEAEVLLVELAPIDAAVLERAGRCRRVVRYGTGLDNVDLEAADRLGIAVLGVPGYAADSVADHTLAMVLAHVRKVLVSSVVVGQGSWRGDERLTRPRSCDDLTLGLAGLGAIGIAVARRATAFGMTVLAHDPYASPAAFAAAGAASVDLDELFAHSDVVSLHLPVTPETTHLVDAERLASLRPGAMLVNTARGGLVDHDALRAHLDADPAFVAALDVTDPEPPEPDSWLRHHDRVLVTPHLGFWSDRSERNLREAVAALASEALLGEPGRPGDVGAAAGAAGARD